MSLALDGEMFVAASTSLNQKNECLKRNSNGLDII